MPLLTHSVEMELAASIEVRHAGGLLHAGYKYSSFWQQLQEDCPPFPIYENTNGR